MKTIDKIEKLGYKVIFSTQGNVFARKGSRELKAENITQLFKKITSPI